MNGLERSWVVRYSIAAASVVAALLLTRLLGSLLYPTVFQLFFAAVVVSSWYGGLGPGIFSALLSAVSSQLFLIIHNHPAVFETDDLVRSSVFVIVSLFIVSVSEARRRTESARRMSDQKYRQIVETATEGIWMIDRDGRTTYINPRLAEILGYPPEEILHRSLFEFAFEEDQPLLRNRVADRRRNVPDKYDFRFRRRDGTEVWTYISGSPVFDRAGEFVGSLGMLTDITALREKSREAEEGNRILDAVLEYIPEGLTIADAPDGRVRRVSRHGLSIGGRTKEAIEGITIGDYATAWNAYHADGVTPHRGEDLPLARAIRQGQLVTDEEVVLERPDGRKVTLLCNAGPIRDGEGRVSGGVLVWRDITDRKHSESRITGLNQELDRRVKELETLFSVIPIGIAIAKDSNCDFIHANPALYRMLGLPEGANTSVTAEENQKPPYRLCRDGRVLTPDEMPMQVSAASGREFRDVEVDCVYENGKVVKFLTSTAPLFDEDGQPRGCVTSFLDISERKKAEEALRASEERYRSLFTRMSEGFGLCEIVHDSSGWPIDYRYLEVNPAFEQLTGLETGQVIGRTAREVIPTIEESWIEAFGKAAVDGVPVSIQDYSVGLDKWFEAHAFGTGPGRFAHFFLDVTGRKKAEIEREKLLAREKEARGSLERALRRLSQLQAITQSLSQATTVDGVARVVVDQGVVALGAAGGGFLLVQDGSRLDVKYTVGFPDVHVRSWNGFPLSGNAHVCDVIRTGEPLMIETGEEKLSRYPDLLQYYRGAVAAIPLSVEGRVVGCFFLSYNEDTHFSEDDRSFLLTLAHNCSQALERARLFEGEMFARRQAESALRAKDEFIMTISHELRTPLVSLLGWSRMLSARHVKDPELSKGLAAIENAARNEKQLVEDVLDFACMTTGRLKLDVQKIDLPLLLMQTMESLEAAAKARSVSVNLDMCPEVEDCLRADPERLRQVVWNLLSNAIKFTPQGGRVDVKLAKERRDVVIRVRDSGIGISPEFLPFVFEPFRQADGSPTRRHGGLGLGLALVRHLVELHGGTVSAGSEGEGKGSEFTVRLPCD